jgi:hypothetical protein
LASSSALPTTASFSSSFTEHVEYATLATCGKLIACSSASSWNELRCARRCASSFSSSASVTRSGCDTMPLPEQLGSSRMPFRSLYISSAGSAFR